MDNIRTNCICPSAVMTPMHLECLRASTDAVREEQAMLAMQPNGRFCTPQELAGLYVYLASDEASFANGAAYMFDGGFTAS